jgi:hypothetical protein
MQNIFKLAENKQVFAYLQSGKKKLNTGEGFDAHGMMAS